MHRWEEKGIDAETVYVFDISSKTMDDLSLQRKPLMEEKRKDTGTQPAASSAATTSTATATPPKQSDTAASEPPTSRRRGQKRKGNNNSSGNTSNSATTLSKRQAREKLSAVPFPPIHNGPCTRARQSPNTAAAAAAAASASFAASSAAGVKNELGMVAPLEFGGGKTVKAAEEELRAAKEDLEALEGKIEAEYENFRSRGTNAHVVPIHCGWFSWTKVHPLEERALPSFFNGKSQNQTPEIYMEIRNWIMNKFHANPNTQIELKDLSELSVGESDARQEVMEFLDHWGLINFHPLLETDSVMENADANGAAKTDSLAEILYCFEKEQSCAPVLRTNVATPAVPSGLFPESAIAEELVRPEGPAVEYHCNSCSADCSRKRYHCQKQADFDLCTECFNNGKFGSDMSPSDFILMEPAEVPGVSGGKWTDQETLLLLEALELYKENWNEIAEHVATKTKAQCILHFVQMPIEDTFLDCDDEIDASSKENADPVSNNNDSLAPKDAPETTESIVVANENQMVPSPMDISKSEDASELEVSKETSENFALKALTEAFEAVGSFPMVGDQLSFAEAANPAMALAAFLVGLVDPNVATASARNSSKMISSNSSGMHLASRHCFLLEDPPDYKKKSIDSERSVVQTVEQDAEGDVNQNDGNQKEKESHDAEGDDNLNDGKQKEKKPRSVLDGSDISNDHNHEKDKDSVTEENGQLVSPSSECIDKDHAVKEPNIIDTSEEVAPVLLNESDNADLSKDQAPSAKEESNDLISKDELLPSSVKESEASECGSSQCAEAPKDADAVPLENKEPKELVTSNSMVENGATTGEEEVKDSKNANEDPSDSKNVNEDSKNANVNEDPLDSKNANEDSKNANEGPSDSMNANEEPSDSKNANEDPSNSKNANEDPLETKNDHSIDKVKRAAVTAISAAAVKAKILANQEEDQIRQLATLLIEKQLHKLETKLAFFSEMENLVTRVREQMDRSRQRLYHERAQIIAARLGLPASGLSASSSRPMQQSLPINRVAMGFANAAPRPPMNMTSQRPPVSRPIMTSGPPSLSPFVPTATAANSVRPSNQDKLSSVGMK